MSADIPTKIMFENTRSVHLTVYRGTSTIGDSLNSLNMLRMRSGLHLFYYIWLYIGEQSPFKNEKNLYIDGFLHKD